MRKYVLITFLFLVISCTSYHHEADLDCPNIIIPSQTAFYTKDGQFGENFQVEIIGFQNYCYGLEDITRRYVVIKPKFRITRLRAHDETSLDISFYTQTIKGPPEYLGKNSYSTAAQISLDDQKSEFWGPEVKVKIPPFSNDFEISLGLNMNSAEINYKNQRFDTRYFNKKSPKETSCNDAESSSCECNK